MFRDKEFIPAKMRRTVMVFGLVVIVVVLLTGCDRNMNTMLAGAGSGSTKLSQGIDPNNEGSVQLRIGDDPATPEGRIMALRLDITSMKLWNSSALAITACTAGNGNGVYNYTVTRGSAPAIGQTLDITGMTDPANNGTFIVTALGVGAFTVVNASAALESGSDGTAITKTAGPEAIDFLVDPVSVELTHSSTITVPIAQSGANPNTSYDRLDIAYSGSAITYMDVPSLTAVDQELGPLPNQTVDLSTSPVTLGTDPVVINVNVNDASMVTLPPIGVTDLGVGRSVQIKNGVRIMHLPRPVRSKAVVAGKVTAHALGATLNGSPLVTVSQSQIQSDKQQPQNGQIQHVVGPVTRVVGNAITVKSNGANLTFQTDENTRFQSITLPTALNAMVEMNGSTQSDGSLYADEVELVDIANGVELEGTATYAYPDADLYLIVQTAVGSGTSNSLVGKTVYNRISSSILSVDTGDIDMTGVNAVFDGSHLFPGQQVEVESYEGLQPDPEGSSGLLDPYMVELEQQTISGTAANYAAGRRLGTGTFDLMLPLDGSSPLANLNLGYTSVHVYQQSTTFPALNTIKDGARVQVRGLLLCQSDPVEGACPTFVMVAAKITVND